MEEYNDEEIEQMVTSSPTFSSIEAYAFGFMTGFVHKINVCQLETNIISKLEANQLLPSRQKFRSLAELLYNLRHIQASDIDTLTNYFQQIESKVESEFDLLSKVQLFYFGRFHSLYSDADVIKQMNQANAQNKVRRNMNKYDSEAKILKEIKKNLDKEINNQPPPPFRSLQKLNVPKTSSQIKVEPKQEEIERTAKQQYPIQSEISMEIEMPEAIPPQSLDRPLPLPQTFQDKKIAKKSGKNPPPKPEPSSNPPAFPTFSEMAPTNFFSLGLLAETFRLNAQMQSQSNKNQFSQFPAAQAVIDLVEEEEEEEIIFEKKSFPETRQALPNHSIIINKTSQIDSDIHQEDIKLNHPDKGEINSPKYQRVGGGARKSVPLKKTQFEEEEKSSPIIFHPVNPDDIYDISYCSSDNVSYVSNPKLPDEQDTREFVLSYKSENEPSDERELSFDGNINVFCK